jgi:dTDP-4-amino-4,6-dideoxygalactose transaminase
VTDKFVSISAPRLGEAEEQLVLAVIRSGQLAQGPMVGRLEELAAAMAGTEYAVAVSNGTVALEAALEVAGIGPGDEVITTPFTFVATLNAILRRGAGVRFADITRDFVIDPAAVEASITPQTRAILPVHLYGLMADMEAIDTAARRYGLLIIEDAAQAHGAARNGRPAGGYGLGCFSFYATKNVTSGEGGMVTTSDPNLAERLRLLRNQGMRERYEYEAVGHNWRMTDVAAALAIPQMERLSEINRRRRENASRLTQLLTGIEQLETPHSPEGYVHAWHQYTVLLPPHADRDQVVRSLRTLGIGSGVYYPRLVWDYPPFREHPLVQLAPTPHAADASRRCLSLPIHPDLGLPELERVAQALRSALA